MQRNDYKFILEHLYRWIEAKTVLDGCTSGWASDWYYRFIDFRWEWNGMDSKLGFSVYLKGWAAQWSQCLPGRLQRAEASSSRCPDPKIQKINSSKHVNNISFSHAASPCSHMPQTESSDRSHCCRPQETWDHSHRGYMSILCPLHLAPSLSPSIHKAAAPHLSFFQCSREQSTEWD